MDVKKPLKAISTSDLEGNVFDAKKSVQMVEKIVVKMLLTIGMKQNYDQFWTERKVNASLLFSCLWLGAYNIQNQILKCDKKLTKRTL